MTDGQTRTVSSLWDGTIEPPDGVGIEAKG